MSSLPPFSPSSQSLSSGKIHHKRNNSSTRYDLGTLRKALAEDQTTGSLLPMGKDEFKKRFAVAEAQAAPLNVQEQPKQQTSPKSGPFAAVICDELKAKTMAGTKVPAGASGSLPTITEEDANCESDVSDHQ